MIRIDAHGQRVTEEELAAVVAAALAVQQQAGARGASAGSSLSLTDEALAALVGAMAAAGTRFGASEPPAPQPNPVWRRATYEQSVRPRWR
jgi:hypothetical protein